MLNNIKPKYIYFALMILEVILTCLYIITYTNKINKNDFDLLALCIGVISSVFIADLWLDELELK